MFEFGNVSETSSEGKDFLNSQLRLSLRNKKLNVSIFNDSRFRSGRKSPVLSRDDLEEIQMENTELPKQ